MKQEAENQETETFHFYTTYAYIILQCSIIQYSKQNTILELLPSSGKEFGSHIQLGEWVNLSHTVTGISSGPEQRNKITETRAC
jgi:hypothetical protein